MRTYPKATRRASPLPSPRELLRAVGRGRGWGGFLNSSLNRDPPTRRAAFGAAPPSPPLRGGRDGARGTVSALSEMYACLAMQAGTTGRERSPDEARNIP